MNTKLCPIMSTQLEGMYSLKIVDCARSNCALWVSGAYTTEGLPVEGMCAYRLQAMINSDGKVVV